MAVNVVIGANYGDEGKGLVTNALTKLFEPQSVAVVRFNGGAQAGHTVQLESGHRHVFSHFGSGALSGADTILSKHFIINPKVYQYESLELSRIRNDLHLDYPMVYVSSESMVTMPTDVWVNRFVENARQGNRHGSCGLGINETVTRYETTNAPTIGTLRGWLPRELMEYINDLKHGYAIQRLEQAGIHVDTDITTRMLYEIDSARYANALYNFMWDDDDIRIIDDACLYDAHPNFVFEGAQGLLLDQDRGDFPYVTRSNTGMQNVAGLISGGEVPNIWYVTRAYLTRHGAGPLLNETPSIGSQVTDLTNKPNDWQGSLRFAPLCPHTVLDAIRQDLNHYGRPTKVNIVVTCCDQVDADVVDSIIGVFSASGMFNSVWTCFDPTGKTLACVG